MTDANKIQEEVLVLKAKRANAEKKNEEVVVALEAKHAVANVEADKSEKEKTKTPKLRGNPKLKSSLPLSYRR
ncbi:unnamed protein product [Aureobasidium mustum]|uniref:Uncharacterized protein n=1 Tax=Aureobasidium mustum TaxID=2773714 RepID=A0A9N8PAA9_9PEZI|nr:unnamed protein product [Aureobasidium mustum]